MRGSSIHVVLFSNYFQTFVRPMNTEDWHIFQSYASRVRVIQSYGHDDIDVEVFRALCFSPNPGPLFPNLVSLNWSEYKDEVFPCLKHFLHNSLRRIDVPLRGSEITRLSLFPSIKSICSSITRANLRSGPFASERVVNAVSELVCRWDRLEELECGALSESAWVHLCTIPTLHALDITLYPSTAGGHPLSSMNDSQPVFPALESFSLCTGTLTSYTRIVKRMQHTPLRRLSFISSDLFVSEELQDLGSAIFDETTKTTLYDLSMRRPTLG